MIQLISREEAGLPRHPDSYYPGPFTKVGVCLHNMAVGTPDPVSLEAAKARTLTNYNYHLAKWGAIDIMEAYDLYNVEGHPVFIEGRPAWSNCDAFSGMATLGYRYIGLEVHGNYDTQYPTDVILEGISDFLAACYAGGKTSGLEMKGHRDFNHLSSYGPTSCPGNNLYPLIPELIAEARRKLEGYGEEEEMIYNLERLPKQGNLFVWGAADVFTRIDNPRHSADYLCWLNVKNESPSPLPIEIFGTPELAAGHPHKDTIPPWEKRGYDIYALAGGHYGGSIILKASQESLLATMTLLRLK
jgi:hypothetical protein